MRALIHFGKKARLRFISHLDLQRFFQRALNRTGLPIAYTQGFNPHPVMAFASALALGWTSEYELLDIKLTSPMGRGTTHRAMQAALPEDLPVYAVRMVDDRHPACMALVRAAGYAVALPDQPPERVRLAAEHFLNQTRVPAIRKTKSSEREIDIRPLALSLTATPEGLSAVLSLTEQDTLKPDLLIKTLLGEEALGEARIHRKMLYGQGANGTLTPLLEL